MPGIVAHETKLEAQVESKWTEIINMRSFPSLKQTPAMVDTSVVTGKNGTSAPGQTAASELKFLAAYGADEEGKSGQSEGTNYATCKKLEGKVFEFRVRYPDNSGFSCKGRIWVGAPEAFTGANNALEFPIIIYPTEDVKDEPTIAPLA